MEMPTGDAHCNQGIGIELEKSGKHPYLLPVSFDDFAECSRRSCSVNLEFHMAQTAASSFEGSGDFTAGGLSDLRKWLWQLCTSR